MAVVEVCTGSKAGQQIELRRGETVVGRYPFCDIVLAEHTVSRQHTRFVRGQDGWYVEDMGSLNGTFVNGKRIQSRTRLNDKDRVHVYETLIVFHHDAVTEPTQVEDNEKPAHVAPASKAETTPAPAETIVNTLDATTGPRIDVKAQEKLRAVLEIARSIGSTLDVDEVLPKILDSLFEIFPQSDRGYIMMADEENGDLTLREIKYGNEEMSRAGTIGPISQIIADRVMHNGEAILSTDSFGDDQLEVSESVLDFPIRSMMCAPLMGPLRQPLGIVYVDTSDPDLRFFQDDLEVMVSVGTVAGQAIEYARTHEARVKLDRHQRELALARQVQYHFLPQHRPDVPGYEFFDHYRSAQEVGGDYYDYIALPDGRLAIAVGDVSGKGVSAALLMARLCSDVRYCLATVEDLCRAFDKLNSELNRQTGETHFITFCLCMLDPREHKVTILNAGHMAPILRSKSTGKISELAVIEAGIPLGVRSGLSYQQFETTLAPGDSILLYTDGISEALNPAGNMYGNQRLRNAIAKAPPRAEPLGQFILKDIEHYIGDGSPVDDICLVCFSRLAEAESE